MKLAALVVFAFACVLPVSAAGAATVEELDRCNAGRDAALLPDESVLVLGETGKACSDAFWNGGESRKLVMKLKADGSQDTSFAEGGIAFLPAGTGDAVGFEAYPGGKALIVTSDRLIRLTAGGEPDPAFGNGGTLSFEFQASGAAGIADVAIDGTGRILVAGSIAGGGESRAPVVSRLMENGSLDATFGTNGESVPDLAGIEPGFSGTGQQVLARSDGGILIGGITGSDGYVVNLAANGTLDNTWAAGDTILRLPVDAGSTAPSGARSLSERNGDFSFVQSFIVTGLYSYPAARASRFDQNGIAQGSPEIVSPGADIVNYADGRHLTAVGKEWNRVPTLNRFTLAMSSELSTDMGGHPSWTVGPGDSVSNGVSLGNGGPGIATGTALSDPCEYLVPEEFWNAKFSVRNCDSTILVRKVGGGVAFGDNGFVSVPAIDCRHGEQPASVSTFHVCLPPSGKLRARTSGSFRLTHPRKARPGLKATIRIRPQPSIVRLTLPKALLRKTSERFLKRLKVKVGSKPVDTSSILPRTIQLNLNPREQTGPITVTVKKGGLDRVARSKRKWRYRMRVAYRGEQYAYRWQKKTIRTKRAGKR